MRIIFMGSPDFSVPTLKALHKAGHEIACVYSQPPRSAGRRGLQKLNTPVHQAAQELGIEVRTPLNFKQAEDVEQFEALKADVAIVVAYGLLLPTSILSAPKFGCLNGHGSQLPRWRGAAPIQRAIMAGDKTTAIQIMQMEKGLDTGPVALSKEIAILPDMTAGELHDEMMLACAELMNEALVQLESGELNFTQQAESGVTYAKKIEKTHTRIDWSLPAEQIHNHIRGLAPFPGAWCEMPFGDKLERVKILRSELVSIGDVSGFDGVEIAVGKVISDDLKIACGEGAVQLTQLQRAGKKAMASEQFQLGTPLQKGVLLS